MKADRGRPFANVGNLPAVSPALLALFARYTRWYLGRHFHAIRLDRSGPTTDGGDGSPTVIYLNHGSWWDPLVCLELQQRRFPSARAFAPIDAVALEKYPFFKRLGFVGIDPGSARGAASFLRLGRAIADTPGTMLWVTPQARFADVRERPLRFRPGLGHLASRLNREDRPHSVRFQPLAIEITHWQERLPEVLLRFGTPVLVGRDHPGPTRADEWTEILEARLEETMQHLSAAACARNAGAFENLGQGNSGVGGIYDLWRQARACLAGRSFDPRHGNL